MQKNYLNISRTGRMCVNEDKTFGCHIEAKGDIEVGKMVMVLKMIASAAVPNTLKAYRIIKEQNGTSLRALIAQTYCIDVVHVPIKSAFIN